MEKKSILSINLGNFGSTGIIMRQVSNCADDYFDTYQAYPITPSNKGKKENDINIENYFYLRVNQKVAYYTGYNGCFSVLSTYKFLRRIDKIKPGIIHLHNLHNSYINLPMLFRYIKKNNMRTFWTLHDCWAFTGQCPHFTMVKCDKWKIGCYSCPQYRQYPQSYVDRTKTMYKLKKKWFCGVKDMTIITPSQWLADLVKQSYLKDYPIKVINNGIDLNVFKPTESDFRKKYNIEDKFIVLGVAFGWGERKGLDVFIELSKRLDDRYQIVLVGTDDNVDKQLPDNIISIHRTVNQAELAKIYTVADVFANPTREDNFPTVNMEALACGTPVITFETGGSPESLDETCGRVVPCDDIDAFEKEIKDICENKVFTQEDCINRANQFDMNDKFKEYVRLYQENEI